MKHNSRIMIGDILFLAIIAMIIIYQDPTISKIATIKDILFKLSMAFLASSIFYYITIYIPRNVDRKNIKWFISFRINNIINDCRDVFQSLMVACDLNKSFYSLTNEDIKFICDNVKLCGKPKVTNYWYLKNDSFAEFFHSYKEHTVDNIKELFMCAHLLDTELIKMLDNILRCEYFKQCDKSVNDFLTGQDKFGMMLFDQRLHEYYNNIIDLEKYAKKQKYYIEQPHIVSIKK